MGLFIHVMARFGQGSESSRLRLSDRMRVDPALQLSEAKWRLQTNHQSPIFFGPYFFSACETSGSGHADCHDGVNQDSTADTIDESGGL